MTKAVRWRVARIPAHKNDFSFINAVKSCTAMLVLEADEVPDSIDRIYSNVT